MWIEKSGSKKERLVLVLFDLGNHIARDHPVGMFFVCAYWIPNRHRDSEAFVRAEVDDFAFTSFVDSGRIGALRPCGGVIVGIGPDHAGIPVVINFSRSIGKVSIVFEKLP